MNSAQHRKYCICAAQAVKAMRKLGHKGSDEELRRFCRIQALGRDKDSHTLNNREFDAVLAVLAGYHSMGDLAEQLRLIEQPVLRALTACEPYLDEIGVNQPGREAYVRSVYARVQAKRPERDEPVFPLEEMPDCDLPLVLGALKHTAEHKHGIEHQHPSGKGRMRWDHRVGSRRKSPQSGNLDEQSGNLDRHEAPDHAIADTEGDPF
jgi:hypothetical protein